MTPWGNIRGVVTWSHCTQFVCLKTNQRLDSNCFHFKIQIVFSPSCKTDSLLVNVNLPILLSKFLPNWPLITFLIFFSTVFLSFYHSVLNCFYHFIIYWCNIVHSTLGLPELWWKVFYKWINELKTFLKGDTPRVLPLDTSKWQPPFGKDGLSCYSDLDSLCGVFAGDVVESPKQEPSSEYIIN